MFRNGYEASECIYFYIWPCVIIVLGLIFFTFFFLMVRSLFFHSRAMDEEVAKIIFSLLRIFTTITGEGKRLGKEGENMD